MAEYIEREALIVWLKKAGKFLKVEENHKSVCHVIGKIIDHISTAPAVDVEPVVRCKNCAHWKEHRNYGDCTEWNANDNECAETDPDDFCSYGKRKEATQCTMN